MEFNKEFSHTILHNFKFMKGNDPTFSNNNPTKDSASKFDSNEKLNKDYQKPIIKKDNGVNSNINNSNNSNKNKKNYHFNEKEVENNVNNLKKNLMNVKESGQLNPSSKENAINKKVKSSIEIDSSRIPKLEVPNKIMPDSKAEKKKNEVCVSTNNVYENLKRNNSNLNKKRDYNFNNINNINHKEKEIPSSKKSIENNIITTNYSDKESVNVSVNISERKRSESRGSQQDDSKDKVPVLKDFMKHMKDKIKNAPSHNEGIVWMKGMKDYIDKEREKEAKNLEMKNNQVKSNKNAKDLNDYIDTQKMLIEMHKLESENLDNLDEDINYEEDIEHNCDIINEFKDLDEDAIAIEDEYYNNFIENFEVNLYL
jgi:hypothetical protein